MESEKVYLPLQYEPGKSHISSILERAKLPLSVGAISAMPDITIEERKHKFFQYWAVVLTVKPQDKPFWLGFVEGISFCMNNREITVGVEEQI